MPTVNIEQAWIDTFEMNLRHALQQRDSKFSSRVDFGTVEDAKKRFTWIGAVEMRERKVKLGNTEWQDVDFYSRWVGRRVFDYPYILDKFEDIMKALTDPTSDLLKAATMAARRQKDKVIVEAFGATAWGGEQATVAHEFSAANIIDVQTGHPSGSASNQPLNLEKLLELRARFDEAELDETDPIYIAISPRQKKQLLNTTEVKSADYNTVKALADGKINSFLGFEFVNYNKLPWASNVRTCWAWAKSAVKLGVSVELEMNGPVPIAEKNFNPGGEVTMAMDAVRLYDEAVFQIPCAETIA